MPFFEAVVWQFLCLVNIFDKQQVLRAMLLCWERICLQSFLQWSPHFVFFFLDHEWILVGAKGFDIIKVIVYLEFDWFLGLWNSLRCEFDHPFILIDVHIPGLECCRRIDHNEVVEVSTLFCVFSLYMQTLSNHSYLFHFVAFIFLCLWWNSSQRVLICLNLLVLRFQKLLYVHFVQISRWFLINFEILQFLLAIELKVYEVLWHDVCLFVEKFAYLRRIKTWNPFLYLYGIL